MPAASTLSAPLARTIPIHDLHPAPEDLRAEVVRGLGHPRKALPCKYFYDAHGSRLFDRICELDEYYPTRTEIDILRRRAGEIAGELGPRALVIELGSGSSTKTHCLLDALRAPAGYVPVDIARDHLRDAAKRIAWRFPRLGVWPVCADFTAPFSLPPAVRDDGRRSIYFPGSTIGNFDHEARKRLLQRMAQLCGSQGGQMLIGVDLVKDRARLEAAYNDAAGVTADFNLNLLHRINRELEADFEIDRFEHRAIYDESHQRIEMQLVSTVDQVVTIGELRFRFRSGEDICTEHSYKFTLPGMRALAAETGWRVDRAWTDDADLFAILLLRTVG